MNLVEKLNRIQCEMKAPKDLYNSFGKYKYRNAEGIFEAFKPYADKYKVILIVTDNIISENDRFYVKASATLMDTESDQSITVSALAREDEVKKGMDGSQITGTASSYARKYAMNGLFLLDDTKDADTDEYKAETSAKASNGNKGTNTSPKPQDGGKQALRMREEASDSIGVVAQKTLTQKCIDKGISVNSMLKSYNHQTIDEMTMDEFKDAMAKLDKHPNKKGE